MKDIQDKKVKERPDVAKFIDKIKKLDNPLINELMVNKIEEREKKAKVLHKLMQDAKDTLK